MCTARRAAGRPPSTGLARQPSGSPAVPSHPLIDLRSAVGQSIRLHLGSHPSLVLLASKTVRVQQVVLYPIVSLREAGMGARRYVETLEDTMVLVLGSYGLHARVRWPML